MDKINLPTSPSLESSSESIGSGGKTLAIAVVVAAVAYGIFSYFSATSVSQKEEASQEDEELLEEESEEIASNEENPEIHSRESVEVGPFLRRVRLGQIGKTPSQDRSSLDAAVLSLYQTSVLKQQTEEIVTLSDDSEDEDDSSTSTSSTDLSGDSEVEVGELQVEGGSLGASPVENSPLESSLVTKLERDLPVADVQRTNQRGDAQQASKPSPSLENSSSKSEPLSSFSTEASARAQQRAAYEQIIKEHTIQLGQVASSIGRSQEAIADIEKKIASLENEIKEWEDSSGEVDDEADDSSFEKLKRELLSLKEERRKILGEYDRALISQYDLRHKVAEAQIFASYPKKGVEENLKRWIDELNHLIQDYKFSIAACDGEINRQENIEARARIRRLNRRLNSANQDEEEQEIHMNEGDVFQMIKFSRAAVERSRFSRLLFQLRECRDRFKEDLNLLSKISGLSH